MIESQYSILDDELFELASNAGTGPIRVVKLNNDITNIRVARDILRPSFRWGSSLKPSSTMMIEMPGEVGAKFDLICTDSNGVAKNQIAAENSVEQVKREIAFLGGSTIMGTGSRRPEWTIPAQVERKLHADDMLSVKCLNFGVAGMTSRDSLAQLIDVVLPRKPELVVFYTGWNCAFNFQLNAVYRSLGSFENFGIHEGLGSRQMELSSLLADSFHVSSSFSRSFWLMTNSMTTWLKSKTKSMTLEKLFLRLRAYDPTVNGRSTAELVAQVSALSEAHSKEAAANYLRILDAASAICNQAGIGFLGIFQPNLFWGAKIRTDVEDKFMDREPVDASSQLDFYKALLDQDFTKNVMDLSQIFANEKRQVYIDTGHLSPLGNHLIADAIASEITKRCN